MKKPGITPSGAGSVKNTDEGKVHALFEERDQNKRILE
jgi:hypothetical protein